MSNQVRIEDQTPLIDPNEERAVKALQAIRESGELHVPGVGVGRIVESKSRCLETMPPHRTTTLTIEFKHKA